MFRRNISPPSSGTKNEANQCESKWQEELSFQAGLLLGLFFDPEDGGDMFLRNVG
jgi:hypothetical protein